MRGPLQMASVGGSSAVAGEGTFDVLIVLLSLFTPSSSDVSFSL